MIQDLKLAVRLLLKTPAFTLVAVLTLALGIGANTAIFTVVDSVLLRPAPIAEIERLALVWETDRNSGTTREPASVPDYLDYAARSQSFETMAAVMGAEVNLTPREGNPIRLAALRTTHRFLPMLGIRPLAGRSFTGEEDRAGGTRVVMLSESLWERSFGRDPKVLGETLRLDDLPYTIVGVAPDVADFGILQVLSAAAYSRSFADRGDRSEVDVWTPLQPDPERSPRSTHPIFILGRLAPGVGTGPAQKEMAAIAGDLEREHEENGGRGVFVEPFEEVVFGPVRPALLVLLGAVALVLLVSCVNAGNLLLARGAQRAREVAVRSALGAGGARLARQFLIENLTLAIVSAAAGVGLAFTGMKMLLAIAPPDLPRLGSVAIDFRVLAMTTVVSLLVGLAFGMMPTLQARRVELREALRGNGGLTGSAGAQRNRLRSALVVAELTLAVILVVGAGLLIHSFWKLQQVDPGFRASGVLKAEYQLPRTRYPVDFSVWPDFKEMHAFTGELVRQAAVLPGIDSVAIAGNNPIDPGFTNSFQVVGREAEARSWPEISVRRVTPGYFHTIGLALKRGRSIRDSDGTSAVPVALINEASARRFFPDQDPIGAQVRFWGANRTIVGVVANEKFHGLSEEAPIAVYLPLAQAPSVNGAEVLLLRTSGDPMAQASAARRVIRELDSGLAVFGIEPLEETVARSISRRRFTMILLGLFAAVALILAMIGIYGVLSCGVAFRTREIGIRMALGATPHGVLRLIVGEGLLLTSLGLALGLAGAFALTRLLASLLFGVTPSDPATYLAVATFLGAVALVASYLPARRALHVDPAVALRSE